MAQSRKGSLMEALINVVIGFTINFGVNALILPLLGWQLSVRDNLTFGACMTVVSIARQYAIRRWFNSYIHRFTR